MTTVTGYTATRMREIEDNTVVDGNVDDITGHLILIKHNLEEIDAGPVLGPIGPDGPSGPTSIEVCTSSTRPTGGALFAGLLIYETDTKFVWAYDGAAWIYRGGVFICTAATRPTINIFEGLDIYETDTNRGYKYDGAAWIQKSGPPDWQAPGFLNSWVNLGGAYQTARYSKVDGRVEIQGVIKDGTINQPIFLLAAGYRPAATLTFAVLGNTGADAARVDVTAAGNVVPVFGDNTYISINVSFRVD